jgi:protein SCO1/2
MPVRAELTLTLAAIVAASGLASAGPALKLAPWPNQVATPKFELQDVDGHSHTLASYSGSVVVVYFGFLSCPDLCPATLLKLSHALKKLGPTRRPVKVLFVTLDPTHDSPQALQAYVAAFDPEFTALTGSPGQVDQAAAAFFVQHSRLVLEGHETIDHSTGVFLLDAAGKLRAVGSDSATIPDFVHDLRLLTALN